MRLHLSICPRLLVALLLVGVLAAPGVEARRGGGGYGYRSGGGYSRSYRSGGSSYRRSVPGRIRAPRPRNTLRRSGRRNLAVRNEFRRRTGYPSGRRGYQVDHIVPLCAGGADATWNMQWLSVEAHKAKTRGDLARCRR